MSYLCRREGKGITNKPNRVMSKPSFRFLFFMLLLGSGWGAGPLFGQKARFGAGLIVGATASQINGDLSAGYNKLGLQAGLRGIVRLKERTAGSVEILFAQRGAQSTLVKDRFDPFGFSLTLNYIEVPVQWHYKDWFVDDDKDGFWRVSFNTGLSYGRFLGYKTGKDESAVYSVVPDYLKKNDVSFLIGASFFVNRHLGFTARYVRSIGYLYDYRDWGATAPLDRNWNAHSLYFQGMYLF